METIKNFFRNPIYMIYGMILFFFIAAIDVRIVNATSISEMSWWGVICVWIFNILLVYQMVRFFFYPLIMKLINMFRKK